MKTQIGLPVQLFANTTKGREAFAAIIVDLKEDSIHEEADLVVFTKESARIYARSVRHKDFKKDGKNYWDFLEEEMFVRTPSSRESTSERSDRFKAGIKKYGYDSDFVKGYQSLIAQLRFDELDKYLNKWEIDLSIPRVEEETITLSSSEYEKLMKCEKFVNTFLAKFDGDEMFFKPFDTGMDLAYYLLDELIRKGKPMKTIEIDEETLRGIYLILCGIPYDHLGAEVYNEAIPIMNAAHKKIIELGNKMGFDNRGENLKS
jgi:hypothetical protein